MANSTGDTPDLPTHPVGAEGGGRIARAAPWAAGVAAGVVLVTVYYTFPLRYFSKDRPVLCWTTFGVVLVLLAVITIVQVIAVANGVPRAVSFGLPVALFLVIVVFASFYVVLARVPGQFEGISTRTDSLYFTVATLSTVGYGDIHPVDQSAKIVVILQILFDLVLVAGAASSLREAARHRRHEQIRARAKPAGRRSRRRE
jgi:voltage-gated potassium channel